MHMHVNRGAHVFENHHWLRSDNQQGSMGPSGLMEIQNDGDSTVFVCLGFFPSFFLKKYCDCSSTEETLTAIVLHEEKDTRSK